MSKQRLWAPWRIEYLQSTTDSPPPDREGGCFLCEAGEADLDDATFADRLVLHRSAHATLLLNRYPYSNGHLLIAPHRHVSQLSELDPEARADVMELCNFGGELLKEVAHPQGLNIGANLGRAAGAGVPGHLHFHVVPRWAGDSNFITVVADARVIPQALEESYRQLRDAVLSKRPISR